MPLVGFPEDVYIQLEPALRLATKFITSKPILGWWAHCLYGQLKKDETTGKIVMAKDSREYDRARAHVDVAAAWDLLAKHTTFFWHPDQLRKLRPKGIMYATRYGIIGSHVSIVPPIPEHLKRFRPAIGLSTRCLYKLVSPVVKAERTDAEYLQFTFTLAKLIVHELAHAFYASRQNTTGTLEPFFYPGDWLPEAGRSWEKWIFGARFFNWTHAQRQSVPGRASEYTVALVTEFGCENFKYQLNSRSSYAALFVPVPDEWIQKWFRSQFWRFATVGQLSYYDFLAPAAADRRPERIFARRFCGLYRWQWCAYEHGKLVTIPRPKRSEEPSPGESFEEWYDRSWPFDVQQAIDGGLNTENEFVFHWGPYEMLRSGHQTWANTFNATQRRLFELVDTQ